ncbi:MAG: hypothetical protein ACJA0N_002016 [Pseudohongiellaceae bacterium]|jgi:hypothetical protein
MNIVVVVVYGLFGIKIFNKAAAAVSSGVCFTAPAVAEV